MEKILSGTYAMGPLLGSGGMGSVYEGRHVRTNQRVAIKVISRIDRRDSHALHRFQREAKAVALLKTPHIVSVLDTGEDEELGPYTVMEFLKGRDLDQLVEELGPLPPTLALKISAQIALGLKAAHGASIVHRDIKPANVFLETTSSDLVVCRVLDFGIAKVLDWELADTGLTNSGSMMGSPRYMAPEQARRAKHADHRADMWSLGVTIYKALTAATPTDDLESMADLIISLCQEPARPLQTLAPWVEPEIATLVHGCLAIDPAARTPSADAWLAGVRPLLPGGFDIHASELVPLSKETRGRVAERVAVAGFSTGGRAVSRNDELAATENAVPRDLPTRIEGVKTPPRAESTTGGGAISAPKMEESQADQPLTRAIAEPPARRVWHLAALGAALSLGVGFAGWKLVGGGNETRGGAAATATHAATLEAGASYGATPAAPTAAPPEVVVASSSAAPSAPTSASASAPTVATSASEGPRTPTTPSTQTPRPAASAPKTATPAQPTVTPRASSTATAGSGELKGTFE